MQLRVRVIALENLGITLLVTGPSQLKLARSMAAHVPPCPGAHASIARSFHPRFTAQTRRAFAHTVISSRGGSMKIILAVTAILIGIAFLLGSCA